MSMLKGLQMRELQQSFNLDIMQCPLDCCERCDKPMGTHCLSGFWINVWHGFKCIKGQCS
jgi:hypothetical protein